MRREKATQLMGGVRLEEDERLAWNPRFRPGAAQEPWSLPRESDPHRPFRCMGMDEFQRRLATMLSREGARIYLWRGREPNFLRQTTLVIFYVAAPHASEESWCLEGGGLTRAAYV